MSETIVIGSRFNGPPNSGNGGYVCGLMASHIASAAEVTLRKPLPLERPLALEHDSNGQVLLKDGADILAAARPAQLDLALPLPVDLAAASAAAARYIGFQNHYFPDCFVCGPAREQNDGLRIFAGPLSGRQMVAAPWVPSGSLADENGWVQPEFLWAALDCPGYFAITGTEPNITLLGRMTAEITQRIQTGSQNIILGWEIEREGRKRVAGTAVFTASGALCAKAKAIWIEIEPAS